MTPMTRKFEIEMTIAQKHLLLLVDGKPVLQASTTFTQEMGVAFGAMLFEHLAVETVNSEGSDAKPGEN